MSHDCHEFDATAISSDKSAGLVAAEIRELEEVSSECMRQRRHYQAEKSHIFRWAAQAFVTLSFARFVLDQTAIAPSVHLSFASALGFHAVFGASYFFILYKIYRMKQYDVHYRLAKEQIAVRQDRPTSGLHLLPGHLAKCSSKWARALECVANVLVGSVYLAVAVFPSTKAIISDGKIQLDVYGCISGLVAVVIIASGLVMLKLACRRLRAMHVAPIIANERVDDDIIACIGVRRQ